MAVIKGYFDDRRSDEKMWTIAGYVGNDDQWKRFEAMWPIAYPTMMSVFSYERNADSKWGI